MTVIIILTLFIAGLSVYDFLSSKTWQEVTSTDRNEIVFEERNHEYGAYQIRKNYNTRLILILASVVFAVGVAFGIYKVIQNLPEPKTVDQEVDISAFAPDAKPEDEEIVEPLEPEIPPAQQTIQFLAPVVDNNAVEDEIPPQSEMDNTPASNETQEGNDNFGQIVKEEKPNEVKIEKPKEVEILEFVEEFAEFPGPGTLKEYLANNIQYPQTAVELGISGTVYVRFVVSDEGYISNVKVTKGIPDCPECSDAAIKVFKASPRWKPAKNNGKAVNSYYNSKVTFKVQ